MTDRDEAGLRGEVKTCQSERDYVYPDRHWVMHTTDTYSRQGHLLERRHRNPDGSQWSVVCRYDDRGLLLEKEHLSDKPEDCQLISHHHDPQGRLQRVTLHTAKHDGHILESVQYAADGSRTVTSYPPPLGDEQRKNTGVSVESMLHLSMDAVAIMTVLDASGRPARKVLYDADDRVIRRIAFRYDAGGMLVEEGELVAGAIREDFRNLYRYDVQGHQIELEQRWGSLGGGRRGFAYNEHGDVVQQIIEQNLGLKDEDDANHSWTERFTYTYDDRENWIERTTQTIPKSGEPRISMIDRRTLTYYA